MKINRVEYRRVCADVPGRHPTRFKRAFLEALNVFMNKKRGPNGTDKWCYNENHPLTVRDLKEIIDYMDHIWENSEIYDVDMEDDLDVIHK